MTSVLEIGRIIDRYRVESVIGEGGMAVVYRVTHTQLASVHALKILTVGSPRVRARLLREGQAQARLRHPNIVAVTDVLEIDGSPCLIMEFIDGPSLDNYLVQHQPDLPEAIELFRGIVRGMRHAHVQDVIHRDLKPGNVMLATVDGRTVPKVMDFGLAKSLATPNADGMATRTGQFMGTPAYASPEQIRDAAGVDHRADLFSLGTIFYELVTGQRPFVGQDFVEIIQAVMRCEFVSPERVVPGLPPNVAVVIEALLQYNADDRLQSCDEILDMLDGIELADLPGPARQRPSRMVNTAPPTQPVDPRGVATTPWTPDLAASPAVAATAVAPADDTRGPTSSETLAPFDDDSSSVLDHEIEVETNLDPPPAGASARDTKRQVTAPTWSADAGATPGDQGAAHDAAGVGSDHATIGEDGYGSASHFEEQPTARRSGLWRGAAVAAAVVLAAGAGWLALSGDDAEPAPSNAVPGEAPDAAQQPPEPTTPEDRPEPAPITASQPNPKAAALRETAPAEGAAVDAPPQAPRAGPLPEGPAVTVQVTLPPAEAGSSAEPTPAASSQAPALPQLVIEEIEQPQLVVTQVPSPAQSPPREVATSPMGTTAGWTSGESSWSQPSQPSATPADDPILPPRQQAARTGSPGTLTVSGDAQTVILKYQGEMIPVSGEIPPGTYEVHATFKGTGLALAGYVNIYPRKNTAITCSSTTKRCR